MIKKYRLEINYSEVTDENIELVAKLKEHGLNGGICTTEDGVCFEFRTVIGEAVNWDLGILTSGSFLTEIKKALTCGEFIGEHYPKADIAKSIEIEYIWNSAIESHKLDVSLWKGALKGVNNVKPPTELEFHQKKGAHQ